MCNCDCEGYLAPDFRYNEIEMTTYKKRVFSEATDDNSEHEEIIKWLRVIMQKSSHDKKIASDIDNCICKKGYGSWFKQHFAPAVSRDSCNPNLGYGPLSKVCSSVNSSTECHNLLKVAVLELKAWM